MRSMSPANAPALLKLPILPVSWTSADEDCPRRPLVKNKDDRELRGSRIFYMVNNCGTKVQTLFYLAGHLLVLSDSHH